MSVKNLVARIRKFVYDVYMIELPGDMADDVKEMGRYAITEAEERATLWTVPAVWTATLVKGEIGVSNTVTFKVVRKRHKSNRRPPSGKVVLTPTE